MMKDFTYDHRRAYCMYCTGCERIRGNVKLSGRLATEIAMHKRLAKELSLHPNKTLLNDGLSLEPRSEETATGEVERKRVNDAATAPLMQSFRKTMALR